MKSITPELKFYQIDFEDFLEFLTSQQELKDIIFKIKNLARKRGEFCYFAGGVVRDYLLYKEGKLKKRNVRDLDLVLEGDLENFLEELNQEIKKEVLFKSQFLTYKCRIYYSGVEQTAFEVDFVTARGEVYEDIAVLPKVYHSNFVEDLLRRDFTINTLAIGLSPPYEGLLIDLVSGKEDLIRGIIKPLHLFSFVDDPTRIFRGIRYKLRFDFVFSEEFLRALEKCFEKKALLRLSFSRLVNELKLYLNKEQDINLFQLLEVTHELRVFEQAGITTDKERLRLLSEILAKLKDELEEHEKEKAFLLSIGSDLESLRRLGISEKEIERLNLLRLKVESLLKGDFKSKLNKMMFFERVRKEYLVWMGVNFPFLKEDIVEYLTKFSKIKIYLTGEDLKVLGIKEGKKIGDLLRKIKEKKISGDLESKEEEIEFVRKYINDS